MRARRANTNTRAVCVMVLRVCSCVRAARGLDFAQSHAKRAVAGPTPEHCPARSATCPAQPPSTIPREARSGRSNPRAQSRAKRRVSDPTRQARRANVLGGKAVYVYIYIYIYIYTYIYQDPPSKIYIYIYIYISMYIYVVWLRYVLIPVWLMFIVVARL